MILADTSVWADHIGKGDPELAALLAAKQVVMPPFVAGELALGNLRRRAAVLADLRDMPGAPQAEHELVMALIERHQLFGTGIGYVDAHLLASTLITPGARLWTRDKRLHAAALRLGVAARALR